MRDRIGRMDQRITLQSAVLAADGGGGNTKTWSAIATVWAHVKPAGGRETFSQERTVAEGVTRFVIRNRSDVNEACRILWGGETYNIRLVRRSGTRSMYLDIDAERGVST